MLDIYGGSSGGAIVAAPEPHAGLALTLTQQPRGLCEWPMLAFCIYIWLSAVAKKSHDPVLSAYWKMRVLAAPSLLTLL
eukprot:SAG11_NODE_4389_length_1917_cov_1.624312_1_plen_78_part_10